MLFIKVPLQNKIKTGAVYNLTFNGHWQRAAETLLRFNNHVFSGACRHFPAFRKHYCRMRVGFELQTREPSKVAVNVTPAVNTSITNY